MLGFAAVFGMHQPLPVKGEGHLDRAAVAEQLQWENTAGWTSRSVATWRSERSYNLTDDVPAHDATYIDIDIIPRGNPEFCSVTERCGLGEGSL
ncbi:MAG: hypothetical protein KTR31_10485 [Myxococcales bacterium]|nr:hypothetical protein [Myxococcales bacterium]